MSFRLISPMQTFFGMQGQLLRGGELRFYQAGTTTPKDVFAESGITSSSASQMV